MVRVSDGDEGLSDYERLDRLVGELADRFSLRLLRTGWTRRTYDLYTEDARRNRTELLVRVESFVTTNGEISLFDDRGLPFARALGEAIERTFDVGEATIVRADRG